MKRKVLLIFLITLIILGQAYITDKHDIQVGEEDDLIELLNYEDNIHV